MEIQEITFLIKVNKHFVQLDYYIILNYFREKTQIIVSLKAEKMSIFELINEF